MPSPGIDFGQRSVACAGLLSLTFLAVLTSADAPSAGYPVTLDGNVLFTIEAPRAPYTAAQRATDISNDLLALARSTEVDASSLRMVPGETDTILLAGHTFVMSITDEDARRAGLRREDLAGQRRHTIQKAVAAYRRARAPWLILRAYLVAMACWAAAAAFIFVMYRLKRRAVLLLGDRYHRFLTSRHLDSVHAHFGGQLLAITDAVASLLAAIAALVAICLASDYSLSQFPGMAGISRSIFDRLQEPVILAAKLFAGYLPHLFVVLLIAAGTYVLTRILRAIAQAAEHGDISFPGFYPEWARPTSKLLTLVLAIFALVVMFPYLPGGDSPAFRGISIFIGVLVSLGSSSAMGNLIAGIILTYMHPYRVGDRVRISDTVGDVQEKSFLVTRLRTVKNVEIILPNSMILGAHILNYTVQAEARGLILHTSVTLGYDVPWRAAHELLIRAAKGTDGILTAPEPFVLQTSLNDSHITYEINAFTNRPSEMECIVARMHERIQDEFNRAGVEILSPAYLSLRDGNPVTIPKQNRTEDTKESWFTLPRH
jgi:small-conductance mechanosensitive channel